MKGIKKVCSESKKIPKGYHLQLMYDPTADELFTGDLLSQNSFISYPGTDFIAVCNIEGYMSMGEIYEEAIKAIRYHEAVTNPAWMVEG